MSMTMTAAKEPRKITGRMVLIGFIVFFGVIGTVNGIFMYLALQTWPGLTTDDPYQKGLAYNDTLADGERQTALGWRSSVMLSDGGAGQPRAVAVTVTGKDGTPLQGLDVAVTFERAVGTPYTTVVVLRETMPGAYTGLVIAPLMGRWQADVTAKSTDGAHYRMMHEVTVKQ